MGAGTSILSSKYIAKDKTKENKIVLIINLFVVWRLLLLGYNLSCIIIKFYLNSQNKTILWKIKFKIFWPLVINNLVLLGMMGVGKTTLGKIVAKKLNLEFIDIDSSVEKENSMKIKNIFEKKGEAFFREEEEKQTLKYLHEKNCVIALGGGAFINNALRKEILKNNISVWLDVNIKTLNRRISFNQKRPLLDTQNHQKKIKEIYAERKPIYKLANHRIACNNLSKNDIAEKIIILYEKYKN